MEKAHEFSVIQNGKDAINTSITPWEVEGDIDYNRLIEEFGTQSIGNHLFSRLKLPLPPPVRRGMCFSHRDLDKWLNAYDNKERVSVVSGRGPSERMHIGHLTLYAIPKYFQDAYGCTVYIPVSDDEKFYIKEYLNVGDVERFADDNILDILAMGFDPEKTIVHKDFEHTKIYKYASQVAKKITYSTAKAVFGLKPENNIGWVFYPAMQAAHILYPQFIEGYHQTLVPIGIDQDPFMRLTRDIAERFGFQKPAAIHKKLAPGLEGPKMSSSGNNAIWLSDDEDAVASKVNKYAFSGGQPSIKEHREKGGNPDVDVSFLYLKYFFEEDDRKLAQIAQDYRGGSMLTGELKEYFIEKVNNYLKEHRRKREMVEKNIDEYMLRE